MDKMASTPASAATDRLWPSLRILALSGSVGLIGFVFLVISLFSQQTLVGFVGLAMLAWVGFTFSWVDLDLGHLSQVKLMARRVVPANQVGEVKIESMKIKATDWWYPVLMLHDGSEFALHALKRVSEPRAQAQADVISHSLGRRTAPDPDDQSTPPPPGLVAPQERFTPLRGLDHIYHPESP